jgi:hypothetical protein
MAIEGEFWEPNEAPEVAQTRLVHRPSLIFKYKLKRLAKDRGTTVDRAREGFAGGAGLSPQEVQRIECGSLPTSIQLEKVMKATGWTIFFLFGIDRATYDQRQARFFRDVGIGQPSSADQKAFNELYARLLAQKYIDDAAGYEGGH